MAFTSFRIIGQKAQAIIARAKAEMKKNRGKPSAHVPLPPLEVHEEMIVRLSVIGVLQGALTILAIVGATWILIQILDKLILVFLAFFVAALIDPGVRTMEQWGVPRGLGILLQYFIALFFFLFLLFSLIPIIAEQLQQIAIFISLEVDAFLSNPQISIPFLNDSVNHRLTDLTQITLQNISINQFIDTLQQLGQNLSAAASGSVRFATRLAGSVVSFLVRTIVVLVMAFFIQIEKERITLWVQSFFPLRFRAYMDSKSEAIHHKIGQWARGQVLLGLTVGSLVFIALTILRVPYALTLAVLAAFTEFIPYIGPFIAAVPAVLIALTQQGFMWALIITGVYYVIQWCENNLLVPLIMKRAVGLSPIVIISAMLIGISFPDIIHPVLGILLAVPVTTMIALFLDDWRTMHRGE